MEKNRAMQLEADIAVNRQEMIRLQNELDVLRDNCSRVGHQWSEPSIGQVGIPMFDDGDGIPKGLDGQALITRTCLNCGLVQRATGTRHKVVSKSVFDPPPYIMAFPEFGDPV